MSKINSSNVNVIGVDLDKHVIRISVVSHSGKELKNCDLSRAKFAAFLPLKSRP